MHGRARSLLGSTATGFESVTPEGKRVAVVYPVTLERLHGPFAAG
jgi:hypothetical protein